MNVNIYLNFNNKTEEAFNFYKSIFGGEFVGEINRFADIPGGNEMPENEQKKVMHIALNLGKNITLMGSDVPASMQDSYVMGNNVYISLNTESEEETKMFFDKLANGGKVEMPLEKTFWNAYFGMLTDKYGIRWMFNYDYGHNK